MGRPPAPDNAAGARPTGGFRLPVVSLTVASMASNLLMLTGPLFMLQVYDRVLTSGSLPTLWALTLLVAFLFAFYGLFEVVRSRLTLRIAESLDARLQGRLLAASVHARIAGADRLEPVRDGETLRQFLAGPAPLAMLDVPWIPIYVAVVFLLHPTLGWLAVAGVAVVCILLVVSELSSGKLGAAALQRQSARMALTDETRRSAEGVVAMGMLVALRDRLRRLSDLARDVHLHAGDRSSAIASVSRGFRFFLQSAVLALGAYLVLQGELTAGAMIAASVVTARALAPVDQIVAQWKQIANARPAIKRIRTVLAAEPVVQPATELPLPVAGVELTGLVVAPPGVKDPVLAGLSFALEAGDGLAIAGPSGSGKTSLARTLVGAWRPRAGEYRLDGAELEQFGDDQRGAIFGYLPQDVELMSGTIAENIARFRPHESGEVIRAAELAGVHELIVRLPDGYDTEVGPAGRYLSAGQRQRVGLARAVYGSPFLVVLDEPNSNLDQDGDEALVRAIGSLRGAGSVVVVIAHRRGILDALSHLLVVNDGRQVSFRELDSTDDTSGSSRHQPRAEVAAR